MFTKTPRSSVKYIATNKGPQEKGALQAEQRKLAHRKTTGGEKPKQGQHRTPQPPHQVDMALLCLQPDAHGDFVFPLPLAVSTTDKKP